MLRQILPGIIGGLVIALTGCGGGAASTSTSTSSSGSTSAGSTGGTTASVGTGATGSSTAGSAGAAGTGAAARLAATLGLPGRLLIGLGAQGSNDPISAIMSENLKVDIYERYLGGGDWTAWNAAPCDYVCVVANAADSIGAVPMFTQYQMANNGDGNLAVLNDASFMTTYWNRARLLFQDIAAYKKPALVNLEPDFWGYAERAAAGGDPTKLAALVTLDPDCAALPNNVTGVAGCLILTARKYAPNAFIGFPPSTWGGNTDADVIAFMNAVGAQHADFIVEQTLDRDAGCFEAAPAYCVRAGAFYWDESNQTHPNFADHLASVTSYHLGIGGLPVIWWQTPEGVPASTPGGVDYRYRDDREHYFLTHAAELTAAGGLAVVFSTGESHQTNITTDGGQFQALSSAYLAAPAPLP